MSRRALIWSILLAVPVTATLATARRAHQRRTAPHANSPPKSSMTTPAPPFGGVAFTGICTTVHDGDSLAIRRGDSPIEVRIRGIDAPELAQTSGHQARAFVAELLLGHEVMVRPVDRDDYDRVVAHLEVDGKDVGHAIVESGYAWHYRRYSSDRSLEAAERSAREGHRGLWSESKPIAPWEFRREARLAHEAGSSSPATTTLRGNTSSHVYHAPSCRSYSCRNCTVELASREEAERRGFHACGECGR